MVFIETGDDKGAEHRQNRGSPPQVPVSDRYGVKGPSPAMEEGDTHKTVTDEVAGFADEMMHFVPVARADRAKETHPQRVEPVARVGSRHGGGGLKNDHQNAQRSGNPIQHRLQPVGAR